MDWIDLKILEILQSQGRTKRNELAATVDLSIPAVSERLRRLEESKVILDYRAVLDPSKVGLELTAFIFVTSESSKHFAQIVEKAVGHHEILECHAITGEGSHLIKARTQNTTTLETLLRKIQSWPGVVNTRTSIVLSTPKETSVVSLDHLRKPQEK